MSAPEPMPGRGHSGRIVNAAATLTKLGGSVMRPETLAAMADAGSRYIDLPQAYRRAGEHLAALTGNEAAAVTAGAAAGLSLAVASCVTVGHEDVLESFPAIPAHLPDEVVMLTPQRNAYDLSARQLGVRIVECEADPQALAAVLGPRTACVLWFAGTQYPAPGITLPEIVALAHERQVPVLVDAAAQIPPVSSLWHYTVEAGADLVVFSGGKGLRGPQTSGLVLGRGDLVAGVGVHASPHHGIGRGYKVGKEELAGIVHAVEASLAADEPALLQSYEDQVRTWIEELTGATGPAVAAVHAWQGYPSEAGQPHPRAMLTLPGPRAEELTSLLWDQDPRVVVLVTASDTIALNPQPLLPGEGEAVTGGVLRALQSLR
ncbi:aminotransferase class V-fold PLP-dependent enzyme [Ruania suaedae]|uniref:aminotransferase class V-fold PLP-dependent enzyme n=1 Tax=Ruania suaedae TaxID=2897774 RepID=UPI001E30C280|nr:aminotransferase class V-fold PLP-dependent enzyme [Ruania suaedae]UFU03572.1 aminotransferase class V-fold PLP-dependent enzyme [Ruania suaedae]